MKVEYLPSFLKDLKSLKSTPVFEQIKAIAFADRTYATGTYRLDAEQLININVGAKHWPRKY